MAKFVFVGDRPQRKTAESHGKFGIETSEVELAAHNPSSIEVYEHTFVLNGEPVEIHDTYKYPAKAIIARLRTNSHFEEASEPSVGAEPGPGAGDTGGAPAQAAQSKRGKTGTRKKRGPGRPRKDVAESTTA